MKKPYYWNKKGVTFYQVIIAFVLAIIFLIASVFIVPNWGYAVEKSNIDKVCELSTIQANNIKEMSGDFVVPNTKCPRGKEPIVIEKKDIVRKGVVDQDKAHKIIADSLFRCWKKVGAGEMDPFPEFDRNDYAGKPLCKICDKIIFGESYKEFIKEHMSDMNKDPSSISKYLITNPAPYLMKTKLPVTADVTGSIKKRFGERPTYWEYLYREKGKVLDSKEEQAFKNSIVDDESLTLIRMHKFDEDARTDYIVGGLIAVVGAVSVVAGTVVSVATLGAASPIGLLLIKGGVVGILGGISTASLTRVNTHVFADCLSCNAIGGPTLVDSSTSLRENIKLSIKEKPIEKPICSIIVN